MRRSDPTTKYLLVAGAAAAALVLVGRRVSAAVTDSHVPPRGLADQRSLTSRRLRRSRHHPERGIVTLAVRFSEPVWIEDLIELVETSASAQLYSLLKRPDEKFVTEAAYDNPVFVEDLVRNVAQKAKSHPRLTWFRVEAENFESIHNHNAWAMIESPRK